jgi:hypothetical protein
MRHVPHGETSYARNDSIPLPPLLARLSVSHDLKGRAQRLEYLGPSARPRQRMTSKPDGRRGSVCRRSQNLMERRVNPGTHERQKGRYALLRWTERGNEKRTCARTRHSHPDQPPSLAFVFAELGAIGRLRGLVRQDADLPGIHLVAGIDWTTAHGQDPPEGCSVVSKIEHGKFVPAVHRLGTVGARPRLSSRALRHKYPIRPR